MHRVVRHALLTLSCLCTVALGDNDARLANLKGDVLVNQGIAYRPAENDMPLKSGDRVLTLREGYATIVYSDQCDIELEPSTLEQVGTERSCLLAKAPKPTHDTLVIDAKVAQDVTDGLIAAGWLYLLKNAREDDDQRPLSP